MRIGVTLRTTLLVLLSGCSRPDNPKQKLLDQVRQEGRYALVATTSIGDDRIEYWKESDSSREPWFGRFLIAAISHTGDCLDCCSGEFVTSARPFFQSSRYVALVASTGLGKQREVFFVYDAALKVFLQHSVDQYVPHVHENIVIVGDSAYFASCKTPAPVGRLNLATGEVTMFGAPAPQSAQFYVAGSDVFVRGGAHVTYRVDAATLTPVDLGGVHFPPTEMTFPSVSAPRR